MAEGKDFPMIPETTGSLGTGVTPAPHLTQSSEALSAAAGPWLSSLLLSDYSHSPASAAKHHQLLCFSFRIDSVIDTSWERGGEPLASVLFQMCIRRSCSALAAPGNRPCAKIGA